MMCHGNISWQNVIKWEEANLNYTKNLGKKVLFN